MKITTKLSLIVLLPLLLLVGVGTVLVHFNRLLKTEAQRESVAVEAMRETFELNLLTHEYLQQRTARTEEQWRQKYGSLAELLRTVEFSSLTDQVTLAQARCVVEELKGLFAKLTASPVVSQGLEDRVVGQFLTESRSLASLTSALSRSASRARENAQRRANMLTLLLIGGMAAGVGTWLLLLSRSITRPIRRLHRGAELLAAGQLDQKIGSAARDEIGELSRAFDSMAESLRQRIAERDQALEELRRHRDHLEELVQERTAALARSNAELERFAYVASHDLREPLRMVTSFIQLLDRRYHAVFDAEALQHIHFVIDGARRMDTLIQNLLDYARIGIHGREFATVDCNQMIRTVFRHLAPSIRDTRAVIAVNAPLPVVQGDEVQLVQLFQNLIGNAIKFCREGVPPRIEVSGWSEGADWHFSVRDNGIGIEPRFFERIFVIFQRLHGREEYPGTGIGLAICKKIVERHGGRIWVESQPSDGSVFHFTLPQRPSAKL